MGRRAQARLAGDGAELAVARPQGLAPAAHRRHPAIEQLGARRPKQAIPRNVSGFYGRSLHRDHEGEWDFDLAWKPLESWPVFAGWLRAIRRGHAAVHRGLDITPGAGAELRPSVHPPGWAGGRQQRHRPRREQIARGRPACRSHVTLVRMPDALHDVTLSRDPVRERVFDELGRWLDAYVD